MSSLNIAHHDHILTLTLARGKVNAVNAAMIREFQEQLDAAETNPDIRSIILTGQGKFFSFGFDIPELLTYDRPDFHQFLTCFTALCSRLFLFPKPIVAALNGHTVAGGCILANACDYRVMAEGSGKVALNEVNLGVSFFASATEMLRFVVGSRNADGILSSGEMYLPEQAMEIGLIDELVPPADYRNRVLEIARSYAAKDPEAFAGMRRLVRGPIAEEYGRREAASIAAFTERWYSEATQEILANVQIRG